MAIPKLSSKDLNETMKKAEQTLDDLNSRMSDIEKDMIEKTLLIKNEQEFAAAELSRLSELLEGGNESSRNIRNKIIFGNNMKLYGDFERYGNTIHSKFLRTPINVFNLMTANGPMFRDNVELYIDEVRNTKAKHMLMHSACLQKRFFFEEYAHNEIKVTVELDRNNLLGNTDFNVIELTPFIPNSFHIKSIQVFDINGDGISPDLVLNDVQKSGKCRIVLNKKYELSKVEFHFQLLFKNSSGLYPFGINTLFFLNADFENASYVVAQIEKSDYIEYIREEIIIRDQLGKRSSTMHNEGIEVYTTYSDGLFENKIEPSLNEEINLIARNTKTLYIRIPLLNKALKSIEFNDIVTRQS